jgi:hypothetical protein
LVEIFLLLKLERGDWFCWEKPLIEIKRRRKTDRGVTDFKQHNFTNLKIKRFQAMLSSSDQLPESFKYNVNELLKCIRGLCLFVFKPYFSQI